MKAPADAMLALAREIHLEVDERELCARYLATLGGLFPGRAIVIRVDGEAGRLVVATPGVRLAPGAEQAAFELKRTSADKTRLDVDRAPVRLVDTPSPVVQGAHSGFSIPLVAGGAFYGTLDLAYADHAGDVDADEQQVIPIANQLAVALRNRRLHAETDYLRGYLSQLVDHAGALIMGIDPEWRVTVYNRALSQLTGYTPEEVIGTDVRNWVPGDQRAHLVRTVRDVLAGLETPPLQLSHVSRDGRQLHTAWTITQVARGTRTEAIVAVGQDLTRLESLQRQVIHAEKLATLGQLAAGVVHELQNPLTSIIVYAQYLLRRAPSQERLPGDEEKIRRILEGAERIRNLSRDLVQYAKPQAERLDVVSLNEVVRQAVVFCEHELRGYRGATLTCRLAELPPLYAVRGQLEQVVINLITNAVHELPARRGRVSVRTFAHVEEERPFVGVAVEDNGRGIAPGDLPRIFEPFFTTKSDGRGTGLGLSIVQGIVQRHHGFVDVESAPGRGTTFTVKIPTGHIGS